MYRMLPHLEIRHLMMLTTLAEAGTVTAAAERLGITQSALTHRIREAERRLGMTLFTRTGKRLHSTPAAEILTAAAARAVNEIVRAEEEVQTLMESQRTLVRMGQGTYSRYHWLPEFLSFVEDREPDLEIDLVAQATHYPYTCLREGSVDVAVVYGPERNLPEFKAFPLGGDPLVAIMAPDHPLSDRPYIVAEDIVDERYITYSLTPEPGFEWEAFLQPAGVLPRRLSRVQLPEAIIDLVRAGFGISILSSWAVEPEVKDGTLVSIPLTENGVTLEWWAVIRQSDADESPAMRLVRAFVGWNRGVDGGMATLGF